MACLLLVLVACGDDDSSFAPRDSEDSSSSICEDCDDSSSSVKSSSSAKSSSSRHCEDCKDEAISSGSSAMSSSSVTLQSSSSETSVSSSSSVENQRESCDDENCLMDTRDGQTYKTVKIGEQTWMAENLNYKTENSYCYGETASDPKTENCTKYGRLYTWVAAVGKSEDECGEERTCGLSGKVGGVCPEGWHLPDTTEWSKLFTAVGGKSTAGTKLKSQTGWNDYNGTSGNGTDAYGFSALPAGYGYYDGYFSDEGVHAPFWCATEYDSFAAYSMYLNYGYEDAGLDLNLKGLDFSVRCLKD